MDAKRDANRIPTLIGVSNSDGLTPLLLYVDPATNRLLVNSNISGNVDVNVLTNLIPTAYDYISLSYTGDNLTGVVYKTGGSTGTTVATLTLAYTGSVLNSITRT